MLDIPFRRELPRLAPPAAIPIAGTGFRHFEAACGSLPEGISSPTECALTPPGVLTKLDAFKTKVDGGRIMPATPTITVAKTVAAVTTVYATVPTTSGGARAGIQARNTGADLPHCICCHAKAQSFCKKCTQVKLSFYSKMENNHIKLVERSRLELEAEAALKKARGVEMELADVRARIVLLKKKRELLKHRMQARNEEIRSVIKQTESSRRMSEKLEVKKKLNMNPRLGGHLYDRQLKRDNKAIGVAEMRRQLAQVRKDFSLLLFGIFTIREVRAVLAPQAVDNAIRPAAWMVVPGVPGVNMERPLFQVRDAVCGLDSSDCRASLSAAMSVGALSLPPEQRPHLAAMLYSVQLVNLLAQVNDEALPYAMSLREMCIWDKWSPDLLETDWFKLCHCVFTLCRMFGMVTPDIRFKEPHANLMALVARLATTKPEQLSVQFMAHPPPPLDLKEIQQVHERLKWRERESLNAEWDICDDVTDF